MEQKSERGVYHIERQKKGDGVIKASKGNQIKIKIK